MARNTFAQVSTNVLYCTVYFKAAIGMLWLCCLNKCFFLIAPWKSVERLTVEWEVVALITVTVLILITTKQ